MSHVLIVDDLEESRYLLQTLLEGNGYRVTAAANGLNALAAARRAPPDVIVSDVLMPTMDGFALCRAWMQESTLSGIPFIFCSATYTDPEDQRFALALGAVRYLIKPLEAEVFLAELKTVLQEWAKRPAPGPASPLDEPAFYALHDAALARKLERKITQLEATNRKLRESEERYRDLVENSHDLICTHDLDGKLLTVNAAVARLSGYSREALLSMNLADLLTRGARDRFAAYLAEIRSTGAARGLLHIRTAGGETRWWEYDNTLRTEGVPAPVVRGMAHDVTERRAADARIQRLNNLYAALSQCNEAITRSGSEEELFPQVCRDAVEFGGMKMAWIGLLDEATQRVKPVAAYGEGVEYLEPIEISADAGSTFGCGTVGTALRGKRPVWCQDYPNDPMTAPWHELGARAGWGSAATLPLYKNGTVVGAFVLFSGEINAFDEVVRGLLVNMALDVSYALDHFFRESERSKAEAALRESEARFRDLFECNPLPIFALDKETLRFITVNQATIEKYGYSREEFLAMTILDLQAAEDRARVDAELREQYARGPDEIAHRDRRHVTKDGRIIFAHIVAQPIRLGGRQARLVTVSDVTERRLHEAALRHLNEDLERRVEERTRALQSANQELEAFSYSVSHDLRTPLRAINGFSRLLEQDYAGQIDAHGRDMLNRVAAGAETMGHLIDDLLDLSRISRREIRIGPVDLSALAREVAGELQAAEPARSAEWVIAPRLTTQGDPGLLRVLLQNLLGNAWKYSSRREAARIEFGLDEKDGRAAYFVRDNGAGFDMAHAGKLFGAFQRLHASAEFPGSGIGLATVARIIRRHGGEIWAEGRVGEGATFYFTLGSGDKPASAPR